MTDLQLHLLDTDGRYTAAQSAPRERPDARAFARDMAAGPAFQGYAIMTTERAAKLKNGRLPKARGIASDPRRPQGGKRWPAFQKIGSKATSRASIPGIEAVSERARATGAVSVFPPGASATSDRALCELADRLDLPVMPGRADVALAHLQRLYRVHVVDPADWDSLQDRDHLAPDDCRPDPVPRARAAAAETFHQHA